MNNVLLITNGSATLIFALTGIVWLIAPNLASAQLGMLLLDGVGFSTQIGDLASFFLTLGSYILLGLVTGNRTWFYPPMMLLGLAALGRALAWLIHGRIRSGHDRYGNGTRRLAVCRIHSAGQASQAFRQIKGRMPLVDAISQFGFRALRTRPSVSG